MYKLLITTTKDGEKLTNCLPDPETKNIERHSEDSELFGDMEIPGDGCQATSVGTTAERHSKCRKGELRRAR